MSRRVRKLDRDKTLTIDDVFSGFISEKILSGKSTATIQNYTKTYLKWVKDMEIPEDKKVAFLNRSMVYGWVADLKKKGLTTASINHYLRDLRAFVYYCQKEQYCEVFDINLQPEQETEPKTYTEEEIKALLAPPNMDKFGEVRMWVIVNVICATGFRKGTICELRIGDIDLKERMITASHTKNKKFLRVPISSALAPILRDYLKEWRYDTTDDDYVFCSIGGGRMSENALRLAFERYCAARGVERTSLHSIRHTYAKNAVLSGVNPFTLKTLLGHKDLAMSQKYVAIFGEDIKESYDDYSLLDNSRVGVRRSVVKRKR